MVPYKKGAPGVKSTVGDHINEAIIVSISTDSLALCPPPSPSERERRPSLHPCRKPALSQHPDNLFVAITHARRIGSTRYCCRRDTWGLPLPCQLLEPAAPMLASTKARRRPTPRKCPSRTCLPSAVTPRAKALHPANTSARPSPPPATVGPSCTTPMAVAGSEFRPEIHEFRRNSFLSAWSGKGPNR